MLIVLLGLLLRLCVSLHSYSGQNKPPMFGDYEAQRHWMEITYNLPTSEWYFNTTNNDLMYWGLDYPPLTAYHSWLCGHVAATVNSSYVGLNSSRGFESDNHKHFMRLSVLVADLITFIPAIVLFYYQKSNICLDITKAYSISTNEATKLCCLLALVYPGIILIDHGHFQYNCISLGLFVFSVSAIVREKDILGSILFCCALTYKQMELYHALPFFFYLLGKCFNLFIKGQYTTAIVKLSSISSVVIITLLVICLPFITHIEQFLQLIRRLFPIARGVFEDKVANVWCTVNIIYKLKILFTNEQMAKICILFTILAVIPSLYNVFMKASILKFKYSLVNTSLAFFLFSFQVHEKSILLVAVPVLLIMPNDPFVCVWFLCISVFSMLPLLLKDTLLLPFLSLITMFIMIYLTSSFNSHKSSGTSKKNKLHISQLFKRSLIPLFYLSLAGAIILTFTSSFFTPPKRYPDIFPLLVSVYSCLHFLLFLVYFNVRQWSIADHKGKEKTF